MALTQSQQHVADKLKEAGASLFVPLVGADDVHLAVRGEEGQYVEVRVLEPDAGGRAFTMGRFRPKPYVFFVCVTSEPEAWLFPSNIFERFASGAPLDPSRTLDLDAPDMGETLADRLRIYRERWALLKDYRKYRSTLSDPVSLQMMLSMG
jgi:hypothetical protein